MVGVSHAESVAQSLGDSWACFLLAGFVVRGYWSWDLVYRLRTLGNTVWFLLSSLNVGICYNMVLCNHASVMANTYSMKSLKSDNICTAVIVMFMVWSDNVSSVQCRGMGSYHGRSSPARFCSDGIVRTKGVLWQGVFQQYEWESASTDAEPGGLSTWCQDSTRYVPRARVVSSCHCRTSSQLNCHSSIHACQPLHRYTFDWWFFRCPQKVKNRIIQQTGVAV